jgi:hypothetical protein
MFKSTFLFALLAALPLAAQTKPKPPAAMRLYVFNCGTIKAMSVTTFGFKEGQVPTRDSS